MHPLPLFLEAVERWPDNVAAVQCGPKGVSATYREYKSVVDRLTVKLLATNLQPGDRVALCGESGILWGAAYYAVLAAGGTVVPFDMSLPPTEAVFIVKNSGAKVWLGSPAAFQKMSPVVSQFEGTCIELTSSLMSGEVGTPPTVPLAEVAAIVYTSGTTGVAKGVMLRGSSLGANVTGAYERFGMGPGDRFLSVLPMYHTFEGTGGFLYPLSYGASVYYARSLKPNELLEDARQARPTAMLAVPLLLEKVRNGIMRKIREAPFVKRTMALTFLKLGYMTAHNPGEGTGIKLFHSLRHRMGFDQLKYLVSGGAALPLSVARDFLALGFPIIQGYGLTECGPLVSGNCKGGHRTGSVGRFFCFCEGKIENPGEDGSGILLVKGENVMKGYWENPAATADSIDADGWLRTGDVARIDQDGFLFIVGRRKDVIVTAAGKNIYPETLEQAIMEDERVLECIVTGRQRRQGNGEELGVLVVFNPDWIALEKEHGRDHDDTALQRIAVDIVAKVNEQQPDYRRITRIEVSREELEKTTTRKVRRFKYCERLNQ